MNFKKIYISHETDKRGIDGQPLVRYFEDIDCTKPYTGIIEYEKKDGNISYLSQKYEVYNGYSDGICILYRKNSKMIEAIYEQQGDIQCGLSVEFNESGVVDFISYGASNMLFEFYSYDEKGNCDEHYIDKEYINNELYIQMDQKLSLSVLHEEIVRTGNLQNIYERMKKMYKVIK